MKTHTLSEFKQWYTQNASRFQVIKLSSEDHSFEGTGVNFYYEFTQIKIVPTHNCITLTNGGAYLKLENVTQVRTDSGELFSEVHVLLENNICVKLLFV